MLDPIPATVEQMAVVWSLVLKKLSRVRLQGSTVRIV